MSDTPPNVTKGALPVISNLTLRLVLLRLICCLAVAASISTSVVREYTKLPISVFILLHHIMIPFFPRVMISNGLDLLITIAEIGALGWIVGSTIMSSWSRLTKTSIVAATIWWMLLISVAMFAGLKIINTIAVKGRNLLVRLDITDAQWMHSLSKNDPGDSISSNSKPKKLTARDVLIGRSLWRAKLAGEQQWMILLRGLIAFLFVITMVTFTIVAVIFGPVRESAFRPVDTLRAFNFPSDATLNYRIVRNVILVRVTNETSRSKPQAEDFARGIKSTLLWDNNKTEPCITHQRKPFIVRYKFRGYGGDRAQAVKFDCGSTHLRETQPDILVTVNFTELGIRSDSIGNVARNSVQVVFGLANYTTSVLDNTSPVTLIPGMNAFAMANMVIRKQFRLSAFSIFGLFDNYDTFLVTEIAHLITDPSSSPLITHSPDVATLRIVLQVDPSRWRVFQDSHEKSVLKGFSSVGGLWTSLCGIFAILFGSSILRVMFNVKPFSLFGLMHTIQSEQLRDSCLKEYPRIPYELETSPGNRGIVSFLSDYFLDLEFLRPDQLPEAIPLTSTTPSGSRSPVVQSSLFNDDASFTDTGPLLRAEPFSTDQRR